jgi:hypothetical protein
MLFCRDMVGGHFGQQSIIITDDPCSYHCHAFAFADKARLGPNFTAALITQQVCIQINGQWESLAFFSELRVTDGKHGRRNIGQPEHGPGVDGAKGIQGTLAYRHSADHTIYIAFFNKKFDITRASCFIDVLLNVLHF